MARKKDWNYHREINMEFRIISLVFMFLLSSALGKLDQNVAYIQNLEAASYNKKILPEGYNGPGSPVRISASLWILDIHEVDDTNMDFNIHMYFRQSWNDSRLKYNMDTDVIRLDTVENIWTPDLFFVNEREGSLHKIVHPNLFARIKPDGEVLFSSKFHLKLHCPMDLRSYPHDTQKCEIDIESYAYVRKFMELYWKNQNPVGFSEGITMHEFDLIDVTPSIKTETMESGTYTRLLVSLTFKRKFGFYATRLYVPFIILVSIASLSFWIRAKEIYLRLSLLLVILYLMVTISTSMNNFIPRAPYTKGTDVWIGFCESLVFAAFLEFLLVALIIRRETEDGCFKNDGETSLTLDPEDKESKLKSPLSKVINWNFGARRRGYNSLSLRIDNVCRFVFPIIFLIFNIIYWSVYCSF